MFVQNVTQQMWTRPYGVGLLVIGSDAAGPHLFQTCPSGQYWKFKAIAIGARSQAAKTYLERKLDELPTSDRDVLIRHALFALQVRTRRAHMSTSVHALDPTCTDRAAAALKACTRSRVWQAVASGSLDTRRVLGPLWPSSVGCSLGRSLGRLPVPDQQTPIDCKTASQVI
jgi:Proteasome subunit